MSIDDAESKEVIPARLFLLILSINEKYQFALNGNVFAHDPTR